jgi:hypothetical protein
MTRGTNIFDAILQWTEPVVAFCLPPWFPPVSTILFVAGVALAATCRAARAIGSASDTLGMQ